jgi:hypothetical protein
VRNAAASLKIARRHDTAGAPDAGEQDQPLHHARYSKSQAG